MFARLAPFEVRDGPAGAPAVALGRERAGALVPGSVAVILVTIAGTTFDGAQEGLLNGAIGDVFDALFDDGNGVEPVLALRLTNSLFMALTLGVVAGIYWAGVTGMGTAGSRLTGLRDLGRAFAHGFIPIGLRLPLRALLQPRRCSRSRRSSPTCSRTRWARARTSSAPRAAASTMG